MIPSTRGGAKILSTGCDSFLTADPRVGYFLEPIQNWIMAVEWEQTERISLSYMRRKCECDGSL